jgi:hypothetical protein
MEYIDSIIRNAMNAKKSLLINDIGPCHTYITEIVRIIQMVKERDVLVPGDYSSVEMSQEFMEPSVGEVPIPRNPLVQGTDRQTERLDASQMEELLLQRHQEIQEAPFNRENQQLMEQLLFSYLTKLLDDSGSVDSTGTRIHFTEMAKKSQVMGSMSQFATFKFKITPFIDGFTQFCRSYVTDSVIILDYLYRSPVIVRFTTANKRVKTKGFHVWCVEAKKTEEGWVFKEHQPCLLSPPPCYVGEPYEWKLQIYDPHSANDPILRIHGLPPGFQFRENKLYGVPVSEGNLELEVQGMYKSSYRTAYTTKTLKQTVIIPVLPH